MKFNFRKFQSTFTSGPNFRKLILNLLEGLEKADATFRLMFTVAVMATVWGMTY